MPQTLNIAVCEDEAAETVLLCDILNHSDIQNTYTVFTDADSFLASYEYGKYDLLLMDIYMKDSMTGIEAVSIIRETDADIPVAFITTSTEHALESYRLSAIGYIEKPVSAAELSNILHLAMLKKSDAPSLYVKRNKSMERLALSDIMYIEQRARQIFIHLKENEEIDAFLQRALAATLDDSLSAEELTALALETGSYGVQGMALLDEANTSAYGNPEITTVDLSVGTRPGILVSGHDLRDLEMLLEQTVNTGIDVYTHSEMLPAHYYPAFKKYEHFKGNYGNAWWKQKEEFEAFNGPILMTTNCIVPPKDSYKNRIYTTGAVRYPGCPHIDGVIGETKDFSLLIEQAKHCAPPTELEQGTIVGGFAHAQVLALADQIVDAVKSGAIKKFVVMAGCDGRAKSRSYYSDFAQALPKDTVILTAGCAKYKYNKLNLGDINGIPRVLDAGQCNDSYSLAVIALKLKEVFGLDDINDLPIIYNISWYEQKAVIVLLALLSLGVKNIHLGPTLPAFLSPNVAALLVENFGIAGIDTVENDMELFFGK